MNDQNRRAIVFNSQSMLVFVLLTTDRLPAAYTRHRRPTEHTQCLYPTDCKSRQGNIYTCHKSKERTELQTHTHIPNNLLPRAVNWQTAAGWHHLQCGLQAQASSFSWLSLALCWKSIETQLFDYTQVWLRASVFDHYRAISCWRSSVVLLPFSLQSWLYWVQDRFSDNSMSRKQLQDELQCPAAKGTNAFVNTQPAAQGGERRNDGDVKLTGTEQATGAQVMLCPFHWHSSSLLSCRTALLL